MRWYWIDRFVDFESGSYAKSVKNVSLAESHLHDHFPSYPVMPNSLIIEGLAQTGGLLACEHGKFQDKVVLAKVPRMKFYSPVLPGDTLLYTATLLHFSKEGSRVTVTSHKGEELQAEGEIVFAHLQEEQANIQQFDDGILLKTVRLLRMFEVGRDKDGAPLVDPDFTG